MNLNDYNKISAQINAGQAGVIPTDTVYGIIASALDEVVVERIYKETGRPSHKAFIVLISDIAQLRKLGITVTPAQSMALNTIWPGPNSAILPCLDPDMTYLHRGLQSLAVRLPDLAWLKQIIDETGPIIATSANISGRPTPDEIAPIKEQLPNFDFYYDGPVHRDPSRLVRISDIGVLDWIERS